MDSIDRLRNALMETGDDAGYGKEQTTERVEARW